ncbi:MAG: hypothetical protein M3165_02630 [Actinomycetota bacterium]|nr:hypothetical protein [Actinomycetota bacterium]
MVSAVEALAGDQHGVVSRAQAAALGADKERIRREVAVGRWTTLGLHTVAVHRGPPPERAWWRTALIEVGSNAALDGTTALRAAGLEGYTDDVHASVLHGWRPRRVRAVRVHELRGWSEGDVVAAGIRRVRPEVAAVRAATWARTDRQAALILVMTVQQRIAAPRAMLAQLKAVPASAAPWIGHRCPARGRVRRPSPRRARLRPDVPTTRAS